MFSQIAIALSACTLVVASIDRFSPVLLQPDTAIEKCLTASADMHGAAVTAEECTGSHAQLWSFVEGKYRPEGNTPQHLQVFGDKCLDLTNATIGASLVILNCNEIQWGDVVVFDSFTNSIQLTIDDADVEWESLCLEVVQGGLVQAQTCDLLYEEGNKLNLVWHAGYLETTVPKKSEEGQIGTNQCGQVSSLNLDSNSLCQTAWLISEEDYCFYAPSKAGQIGNRKADFISYCSQGHGARKIHKDAMKEIEFLHIPELNQVKIRGQGDLTKFNVQPKDRFALGARAKEYRRSPTGAVVFGNEGLEFHQWRGFINATHFCIHACMGQDALTACDSVTPLLNCDWETGRRANIQLNIGNDTCMSALTDYVGAPVILRPCFPGIIGSAQVWYSGRQGENFRVFPNKCLVGGSKDNKLRIAQCKMTPDQDFIYNDTEKAIVWFGHNQCVATVDGNTSEGSELVLQECNFEDKNQHWDLNVV